MLFIQCANGYRSKLEWFIRYRQREKGAIQIGIAKVHVAKRLCRDKGGADENKKEKTSTDETKTKKINPSNEERQNSRPDSEETNTRHLPLISRNI